MDYKVYAAEFLDSIYQISRQKPSQDITTSMKGEGFALLYMTMSEKQVTPGELGTIMEISSARVAALLNSLEKKGMLRREISKEDRRKILVTLTEKGKEEAAACRDNSLKCVALLMEMLGEEDAGHLNRIVRKIGDAMKEYQNIELDFGGHVDDIKA